MSQFDDDDDSLKSRTGRFYIPHRGGTRVEVGEAINIGGDKPWLVAVKLLGRESPANPDIEPTQTLLVRTGRGATPEEAQREAMAQLTLVYGSPVEPPPEPKISQMATDPPPPMPPGDGEEKKLGFFARIKAFFRG